jgi:two-component system KDP operon response regulator KdpE
MSKSGARILVVDDEIEIMRALQRSLTAHGFEVFAASSGEEALEAVAHHRPDLMLLDLGLPGMSGLEVCKRVREQSNLPIIVLSVKDAERDKVLALDLGADDYVAKPFGINEILARVRVALRHTAQIQLGTEPVFISGPLRVDFAQRGVQVDGKDVKLTPTEYDLL